MLDTGEVGPPRLAQAACAGRAATGVAVLRPPRGPDPPDPRESGVRVASASLWRGLGLHAVASQVPSLRWLRSPPARRARLAQLLAPTKTRRSPRIALPLAAGIGEEVSWRIVLPGLLSVDWLLGLGPLVSALVSAVVFGVCHAPQGAVNAVITGLYGLVCSRIVAQSGGSLVVVVVVHVVYDVTAGFVMARWISRDGSRVPTAAGR